MPYTPPASAGGSALDANNNQVFPAALGVSTVAAGSVSERVLTRAGNSQFAFANADITDVLAMPSLENYSFAKAAADGSGVLNTTGCTTVTSGGIASPGRGNTTYTNSRDCLSTGTTTTAGSSGSLLASVPIRARGNALRRGGFWTVIRFNPVLLAGHQASVGMSLQTAALAGEPSAEASQFIGMICDSADTNWQIFCKPNGAAGTKIDTGIAKITTGPMLALYLYSSPGGANIPYQIENEETQALVLSGSMTLTLPLSTSIFSAAGVRVRNGATVTVGTIQLFSIVSASRY